MPPLLVGRVLAVRAGDLCLEVPHFVFRYCLGTLRAAAQMGVCVCFRSLATAYR